MSETTPGRAVFEALHPGSPPDAWLVINAATQAEYEAAGQATVVAAELTYDADLRRERDEARAELGRLREQLDAAEAGAIDTLRAFAQDEILANAGTEWDRPLGPEQNAVEYVRHLEQALAAADRAIAEFRRQCSELAGELGVVTAQRDERKAQRDHLRGLVAEILDAIETCFNGGPRNISASNVADWRQRAGIGDGQ